MDLCDKALPIIKWRGDTDDGEMITTFSRNRERFYFTQGGNRDGKKIEVIVNTYFTMTSSPRRVSYSGGWFHRQVQQGM